MKGLILQAQGSQRFSDDVRVVYTASAADNPGNCEGLSLTYTHTQITTHSGDHLAVTYYEDLV
jgi:hypothetical protein